MSVRPDNGAIFQSLSPVAQHLWTALDFSQLGLDENTEINQRTVGLAVSGGGDSMALLAAAIEISALKPMDLHVATVDHGLRAEAAAEAARVARFCDKHDIPHQVLRIEGLPTATAVQTKAREARYDALQDWQKRHQLDVIALGHTKDDVAETLLMRLSRGSGVDGLAAMRGAFTKGDAHFIRPFLEMSRRDLRDYLHARNVIWVEDPSNDDDRFARVRARQAIATLDLDVDTLADTAAMMDDAREAANEDTWDIACRIVEFVDGDAVIDLQAMQQIHDERARRLVIGLVQWVGSQPYAPRRAEQQNLMAFLRTTYVAKDDNHNRTLGGCLITRDARSARVTRELGRMPPPVPWARKRFDTRWLVNGPGKTGMTIGPLTQAGLSQCPGWRECDLPRQSLIASPAIWGGDRLIAAPLAGFSNGWQAIADLHFRKWLKSR